MIYRMTKKMYREFGNNHIAVIAYINETYGLRDKIIGLIVYDDEEN